LQKVDISRSPIKREEKSWRKVVFWSVLGIILIIVLCIALSPAQVNGSGKYLTSGDNLLKDRKFISAIVEYRKAEFLHSSSNVTDRLNTARDSEKDITKLEPFYKEVNDVGALNEITKANEVPANVSDGVKTAKSYIENNRPDLALLAATTVTEMDANYQDAWTYLGLANYYMMKNAEISSPVREFYEAKAKDAWQKALEIDPSNQDVQKYLDQLK
jgi:tetratricopeptide (TPR) repeat protein